jgi:hypothetical protein
VVQGVGPEFEPQYRKKKKKMSTMKKAVSVRPSVQTLVPPQKKKRAISNVSGAVERLESPWAADRS